MILVMDSKKYFVSTSHCHRITHKVRMKRSEDVAFSRTWFGSGSAPQSNSHCMAGVHRERKCGESARDCVKLVKEKRGEGKERREKLSSNKQILLREKLSSNKQILLRFLQTSTFSSMAMCSIPGQA
jgi:hypothetical protein